jgi:hypothetical protein
MNQLHEAHHTARPLHSPEEHKLHGLGKLAGHRD